MSDIVFIIQQELIKIITLSLLVLVLQLVAILIIKPVAIRKTWRQSKLKVILGVSGGIFLSLVVFFVLLSPAIPHVDGNPLLKQNDRGQTSQGLTPTPYGPEKPKIGTTTWTPSPTHTFTPTYTLTASSSPSYTPTPAPSLTPTPSGQKQTETPTRTPIPPCYSEGPFFFERPRSGEEFTFGSSVPLIMRINPEMMRQMNYTSYSIRYIPASRSKEEIPLEKWDVIQTKTPLSDSLIETVWTPMKSGTYWLSAALYWDGQYTANALQQCAIKVIVR